VPTKPKVIDEALDRFRTASSAISKQAAREKQALAFQIPGGAWPEDVKQQRQGQTVAGVPIPARPMLSVASLDEPLLLVATQERKAHLGVNVHALSEDSRDDTAEVLQGLYRQIEVTSRASLARSWAYDRATKVGRGWYRVDKVYDPDGGHPLDQKLEINRILNQASVLDDPAAQKTDGSDALFRFVLNYQRPSAIKRRWPKAKITRYTDEGLATIGVECPQWVEGNTPDERLILTAEYWRVEIETEWLLLLDDNSAAPEDSIPVGRMAQTGDAARRIPRETRRVFVSIINAVEELEPAQEWDGQYIPIIPVIGRELQPFDNERRWMGMIEPAMDGVRLTNYAASGAVEMAALEPKAPYELDPEQIDGYQEFWQQANTRNFPYLPFHRLINGQVVEKPSRTQVDMGRMGPNMQLLSMGRDFVQSATATFDPALGKQPAAHRSGRAIIALQDQTVEGNSNYLDNLASVSLPYEACVILDLIPKIYDRPGRIARVLDREDAPRSVMLNAPYTLDPMTQRPTPAMVPPGMGQQTADDQTNPVKNYDLAKGRYGVTVTIGKAKSGRMEAGDDALGLILQADPALMPILGPEWLKFKDFPGSDKAARILTKMRDAQFPFLAEGDQAMNPARLHAENQTLKQQVMELSKAVETDQIKAQAQMSIAGGKDATAINLKRMDNEVKLAVAELGAKVDRISLFLEERARLGIQDHEHAQAQQDRAHETALAAGDHASAMEQQDAAHQQTMQQQAQAAALAPEPAASNGSGA
jgi:hypothetical protein